MTLCAKKKLLTYIIVSDAEGFPRVFMVRP
jgi:hypothetical protein